MGCGEKRVLPLGALLKPLEPCYIYLSFSPPKWWLSGDNLRGWGGLPSKLTSRVFPKQAHASATAGVRVSSGDNAATLDLAACTFSPPCNKIPSEFNASMSICV